MDLFEVFYRIIRYQVKVFLREYGVQDMLIDHVKMMSFFMACFVHSLNTA